jgi:hypothetical protein
MEEDHAVTDGVSRTHDPGAEGDIVGGDDGSVAKFSVEGASRLADCGNLFGIKWAASGMECSVGNEDSADGAEG